MDFTSELIAYTLALPIITFLLGVMYGGAEARKELKEQKNNVHETEFTHTYPSINRYKRHIRAQNRKNA